MRVTRRQGKPDPDREGRFGEVYDAGYADLMRFVSRRVRPGEAEDVVAEVFTVAWRRFEELPTELDEPRAWLFGIAHRTVLATNRAAGQRSALTLQLLDHPRHAPHPHGDADMTANRLDLLAAWERLDPVHAEALALAAWDGLSSAQAGLVLDISPVAFRIRLSRARRALRRHLDLPPPASGSKLSSVQNGCLG